MDKKTIENTLKLLPDAIYEKAKKTVFSLYDKHSEDDKFFTWILDQDYAFENENDAYCGFFQAYLGVNEFFKLKSDQFQYENKNHNVYFIISFPDSDLNFVLDIFNLEKKNTEEEDYIDSLEVDTPSEVLHELLNYCS